MLFNKVFHADKDIENKRLELTDKGSRYSLGPNLTLKNCTIVLNVSASNLFILNGTRFTHCSFEVKQELKNHQDWIRASLKGCQFSGRFSGCDFGSWPGYAEDWVSGSIEDCDFSRARLDGCRFHGCDPRTLKLPAWPCFTFINPMGRMSELRRIKWPGLFGSVTVELFALDPPSTVAVTLFAPSEAKRSKTTPEELRAVLETLDCVIL